MFDREYSFRGKHAQYVKDLVDNDKAGLFNRNVDVYIIAPIIGFLNGRTAKSESGDLTTKIFSDQLHREQNKLKFIYRLIMLLDDKDNQLSSNDKIDRAFRSDNNEEALSKNMEIYEAYVLGGVEHLHEKLFEDKIDVDDFLHGMFEFVKEFKQDLSMREEDQDIYDIISKYE